MSDTTTKPVSSRYKEVEPAEEYVVTTVIARADEPEYREYNPTSDELPMLLQGIRSPEVGETVVNVKKKLG